MIIKKCKECNRIKISHNGVTIDKGCKVVKYNNHNITTSCTPLALFEHMLLRADKTTSLYEFLEYLWLIEEEEGIEYTSMRQLYSAMHSIRKKIRSYGLPFVLVNNSSLGYQLNTIHKEENKWLTKTMM